MKRCLFLVEGPFDRQRLAALKGLFDPGKLEIIPFGTDVLSSASYAEEAEKEIAALLAKDKLYRITDFDVFVQVCDTDGCFIDDSLVMEGTGHILYAVDHIEAMDPQSVRDDHRLKAKTIRALLEKGAIRLYYNSSNIDHAFDGKQNPSYSFKKHAAIAMYKNTRDDHAALVRMLFESERSHSRSYQESWDYIQIGANSLMATSNLFFFLLDYYEYLTEGAKALVDACWENKAS